MNLKELALKIRGINDRNGFVGAREDSLPSIIVSLALIHTEIPEAVEKVRVGDMPGVEEELADVIIRCLDFSAAMGFDMAPAVEDIKRLHVKHGPKFLTACNRYLVGLREKAKAELAIKKAEAELNTLRQSLWKF